MSDLLNVPPMPDGWIETHQAAVLERAEMINTPAPELSFSCASPDDLMEKIVTFLILRADQNFKQAKNETALNKAYYKGLGHEIKKIAFQLDGALVHVVAETCCEVE